MTYIVNLKNSIIFGRILQQNNLGGIYEWFLLGGRRKLEVRIG